MTKLLGYIIITISFAIGIYGGFFYLIMKGITHITTVDGIFNIFIHLVGLTVLFVVAVFVAMFVFLVGLKFLEG